MSLCKTCKAKIIWVKMESGSKMPVNPNPEKRVVKYRRGDRVIAKVVDSYQPHWVTCPNATDHRGGQYQAAPSR